MERQSKYVSVIPYQGDEMCVINKDNSATPVELIGLSNTDVNRVALRRNIVMR